VRRGEQIAIEHGSSQAGRFLHANRFKLALVLVIVEALLVAADPPRFWPLSMVIAGCLLVLYLLFRRELSGTAQEIAWIVAASQAFGVFVFTLAAIIVVTMVLVVVAVAVLAIIALFALLIDRR
jgi:hypothetical protein